MPPHNEEKYVPYAPADMFDLVSNIKRYPEFVKWITALRVLNPKEQDGVEECVGEAVVAFKGFTHTFATRVKTQAEKRQVHVSLVKGPLKHLENSWAFIPQGDGTLIRFGVDYEFSNFVLRALARANHDYAVQRIMETFLTEAERRYGG